jgi:hypothetical protein
MFPSLHALLQAALRRLPLSGRTLVRFPVLNRLRFGQDRLLVELPNGYRVVVFPNEPVGRAVYFCGDVNPRITRTLALLLEPGDTLVDVGANVGVVGLLCLPRVGERGRVVAVEPVPRYCAALRETVACNGITNLEVHEVSLAAGPAEDQAGSAFLRSLGLRGEYTLRVAGEGCAGDVLRNCQDFLERCPPRGVVFETRGGRDAGPDWYGNPAYTILAGIGFRIFQIQKTVFTLRYSEVGEWGPPPAATDFVAVRPDLVERLAGAEGRESASPHPRLAPAD